MIGLIRYWLQIHWRSQDDLRLQLAALQNAMARIEEWQRLTLMTTREAHGMAVAWRLSMETPEIDIRDDVEKVIREYEDQIARLSEQIVVQ